MGQQPQQQPRVLGAVVPPVVVAAVVQDGSAIETPVAVAMTIDTVVI